MKPGFVPENRMPERKDAMFSVLNDWLDLDQFTFEKLWSELDTASRNTEKERASTAIALACEAKNIIYRVGSRGYIPLRDDDSWKAWDNAMSELDKYIRYLRNYEHDL